jgi:hypothetical protein
VLERVDLQICRPLLGIRLDRFILAVTVGLGG